MELYWYSIKRFDMKDFICAVMDTRMLAGMIKRFYPLPTQSPYLPLHSILFDIAKKRFYNSFEFLR